MGGGGGGLGDVKLLTSVVKWSELLQLPPVRTIECAH